jgi:hypothetical protein
MNQSLKYGKKLEDFLSKMLDTYLVIILDRFTSEQGRELSSVETHSVLGTKVTCQYPVPVYVRYIIGT